MQKTQRKRPHSDIIVLLKPPRARERERERETDGERESKRGREKERGFRVSWAHGRRMAEEMASIRLSFITQLVIP